MAPNAHETRPPRSRIASALPPFLIWCGLALLLREMPPDGREHGNFAQFLGRFHLVLLHGPLVVIALVPVLELMGRRPRWASLAPVAGGLLSLAGFLVFLTALDGWLLAWSGGYRGHDITNHMWSGLWLAGVCGATALARCGALPRALYPALLAATVALVVWSGHTGGLISHGDGYLTDKMPGRLRALLGMPAAAPAPAPAAAGAPAAVHAGPGSADPANPAYYAVHVAPILARSCVSCHRPAKHKGGLQMDTYEHLMHGGDDGPALVPGNAKASEILRRIRLPASDDDSMPSDGDKPLTPEEALMIEHWITAGAKSG
jgi:mono/diheme cytochrome c family protein